MSITRPAQTTQTNTTSDRGRPLTVVPGLLTPTPRIPVPDSKIHRTIHEKPARTSPARGGA